MRAYFVLLCSAVFCCCTALGQQAGPAPSAPETQQIVQQFGSAFEALPNFPVLTADLDGDGKQDAVVVATAKDPLLDQAEFHYKVVDPYNAAYGFGDPKVTTTFNAHVDKPAMLLVVSDWRAATPKAKWVVINVPLEKVSIGRTLVKKKPVTAIAATEMSGAINFIYWDGKKWKWKSSEGIE